MSRVVRRVLLTGFLTVIVYPLSYAPVFRMLEGTRRAATRDPSSRRLQLEWFYRPVTMLIDETPARIPFRSWSELWGVANQQRRDSIERKLGIEAQ